MGACASVSKFTGLVLIPQATLARSGSLSQECDCLYLKYFVNSKVTQHIIHWLNSLPKRQIFRLVQIKRICRQQGKCEAKITTICFGKVLWKKEKMPVIKKKSFLSDKSKYC